VYVRVLSVGKSKSRGRKNCNKAKYPPSPPHSYHIYIYYTIVNTRVCVCVCVYIKDHAHVDVFHRPRDILYVRVLYTSESPTKEMAFARLGVVNSFIVPLRRNTIYVYTFCRKKFALFITSASRTYIHPSPLSIKASSIIYDAFYIRVTLGLLNVYIYIGRIYRTFKSYIYAYMLCVCVYIYACKG